MRKIFAIGMNTFREAIRDKILYSLLFFAVLVIVASLAFGALSVHEEVRLTTDLGLAGMSFFLVIIAIFVGVNLVYKELERKTVYNLNMMILKPMRNREVKQTVEVEEKRSLGRRLMLVVAQEQEEQEW